MLTSLRLAVGTLTVIPVGSLPAVNRRQAGWAMTVAPLAVLPLAAVAALVGWLATRTGWPAVVGGLLVVAVLALGTRALHLDGLADTADGFGSGWDRDRALAVMKRGDVGPMGVVTLLLTLGLQAAAIGSLLPEPRGPLVVGLAICASRAGLAVVCRHGVPAARRDGLGVTVAGSVPTLAAGAVGVLVAAAVAGAADPWWAGLVAVAVAGLLTLALVRRAVDRFGGVTGDVMGAAVELALTVLLLALAAP